MLSSTLNGATTFPGLQLKAWARITAAGALVKGLNVASITKGAAGVYTVNFSAAMASVNYIGRVHHNQASYNNIGFEGWQTKNVSDSSYTLVGAGSARDAFHYVEFWE